MKQINWSLLQQHTIDIYGLKDVECQLKKVRARDLLLPERFDLFAKLYYLRHVSDCPEQAQTVYATHIITFNPDGKEPGRDDKNGVADFVASFNQLVENLSSSGFDENISVIPVDSQGVILDGAHRVAALAFLDKEVTVAQFEGVKAHVFDYAYFKQRGLSWDICDCIAYEMAQWLPNLYVACLWPRLGGRNIVSSLDFIKSHHPIAYKKTLYFNLASATRFVRLIYGHQPWTQSVASVKDKALRIKGSNRKGKLVFFTASESLEQILDEKNQLRVQFGLDKDSLHVTDNIDETQQIAYLSLTAQGNREWQTDNGATKLSRLQERLSERWQFFRNVTWINFKVKIWRILH